MYVRNYVCVQVIGIVFGIGKVFNKQVLLLLGWLWWVFKNIYVNVSVEYKVVQVREDRK